jgi:hypothetical protein
MIMLRRIRDNSITEGLRGAGRAEKLELLIKTQIEIMKGNSQKHDFKSSYWSKAKPQLKKEASNKCAYCETPVASAQYGDVEHFRPKSIYWWLAYCYDNYSFSCQICNQQFKSDKFPFHGKQLPAPEVVLTMDDAAIKTLASALCPDPIDVAVGYTLAKFEADSKKEKSGLPDPYLFDPEPLFKWKFDEVLEEVEIAPRKNTVASKRAFAAAIDCLGLNREELRQQRGIVYLTLDAFKFALENGPAPAVEQKIKNQIKRMMQPKSPYAAMARYFVGTEWKLNLD